MSLNPRETKIFDPSEGFRPFVDPIVATDSSVVKRGDRWWMYLAGKVAERPGLQLFSASLPAGAPLSPSGWNLTPDSSDPTRVALLAPQERSAPWDLNGGRHCPAYVKGWDPGLGRFVERIYYAGGAGPVWGPYTIGYLEWDGERWVDQPEPVFVADAAWEHGSVFEPNLIYEGGEWKMWYVAGSHHENYLIHGFASSPDGRTGWTRRIFGPPEIRIFDFCVIPGRTGYEAVFSRLAAGPSDSSNVAGLYWCHADTPAADLSGWGRPVQIMTAEDRGWHSGPWKPSVQYSETERNRLLVFFDGVLSPRIPGSWPFAFTLGCLEIDRPEEV
jgi:hypothetical protein